MVFSQDVHSLKRNKTNEKRPIRLTLSGVWHSLALCLFYLDMLQQRFCQKQAGYRTEKINHDVKQLKRSAGDKYLVNFITDGVKQAKKSGKQATLFSVYYIKQRLEGK